jgi:hypothetical protein
MSVDEGWMPLNFLFLHLQELDGQAIRDGSLDLVALAASHLANKARHKSVGPFPFNGYGDRRQ